MLQGVKNNNIAFKEIYKNGINPYISSSLTFCRHIPRYIREKISNLRILVTWAVIKSDITSVGFFFSNVYLLYLKTWKLYFDDLNSKIFL